MKKKANSRFFITGISNLQVFKSIVHLLIKIIFTAFTKDYRYLHLTPYCLRRQFIYDKKTKRIFICHLRDLVDYNTLNNIYTLESYSTEKLRRNPEIRDIFNKIVESGKTPLIIDCGANIGLATKYFLQQWPSAHAISIEPDEGNIDVAKKNNREISNNITFYCKGISCDSTKGYLIDTGNGNVAFQTISAPDGNIDLMSISELIDDYETKGHALFIIKIDIEGFESVLFSKKTDWINKTPLIIIELHDWMLPNTSNSYNFLRAISSSKRDFITINENIFSIKNTLA